MPRIMRRDRLAQHRKPARRRILVRPLDDRPRRRFQNLRRPAEIGKPLPQIDRAIFGGGTQPFPSSEERVELLTVSVAAREIFLECVSCPLTNP